MFYTTQEVTYMSAEVSQEYFTGEHIVPTAESKAAQRSSVPPPTLAELAIIAADEHTILTDKGIPSSLHHTAGIALRNSGLSNDQLWKLVRNQAYGLPLKSVKREPSIQAFLDKARRTEPDPTKQIWVAACEVVVWKASQ